MTVTDTSWPDVAREQYDAYLRLLAADVVSEHLANARARDLTVLVPLLLGEISKRNVLLTAVRQLCGTPDGLYDRDPAELVSVADILAALDGKAG